MMLGRSFAERVEDPKINKERRRVADLIGKNVKGRLEWGNRIGCFGEVFVIRMLASFPVLRLVPLELVVKTGLCLRCVSSWFFYRYPCFPARLGEGNRLIE